MLSDEGGRRLQDFVTAESCEEKGCLEPDVGRSCETDPTLCGEDTLKAIKISEFPATCSTGVSDTVFAGCCYPVDFFSTDPFLCARSGGFYVAPTGQGNNAFCCDPLVLQELLMSDQCLIGANLSSCDNFGPRGNNNRDGLRPIHLGIGDVLGASPDRELAFACCEDGATRDVVQDTTCAETFPPRL